jgi:hypothetical protein
MGENSTAEYQLPYGMPPALQILGAALLKRLKSVSYQQCKS